MFLNFKVYSFFFGVHSNFNVPENKNNFNALESFGNQCNSHISESQRDIDIPEFEYKCS